MAEDETESCWFVVIVVLILFTGQVVNGSTLETDREVLLQLKSFLMLQNKVNQGKYVQWNLSSNPCDWSGITCTAGRVTGINLSSYGISGYLFGNFSGLTELSVLDLSKNTIGGGIPSDFNGCGNLRYLNLSHNIIEGGLNLTGVNRLEVLDLTRNRLVGGIQTSFPAICDNLVTLNISENNFTGRIDNCFDECSALQYLDLSANNFDGKLWLGFPRLLDFSIAENNLTGELSPSIFSRGCNLMAVDLSGNHLYGEAPGEIVNCRDLTKLILWGNNFTGLIPSEWGSLVNLSVLVLGSNKFFREVPESLLNCSKLFFLDISKNDFGGNIQDIFGRFTQVKNLVLHGNLYTGGIYSSGILGLRNVSRLDISYNNFSTELPVEFSNMPSLRFLVLAHNKFKGNIPVEYGNLSSLQALDLSYNKLTGSIPPSLGKMDSLMWLMLANNHLTGEIPTEIGNCGSLLWLNLANNRLSGKLPPQLSNIGVNVSRTFELNRLQNGGEAGSGECLAMKRWLPADYPPFSFVYTLLTRKSCRSIWDQLLKGHGLFPLCTNSSMVRKLQISGYIQLSGNRLTGEVPREIGSMRKLSLLNLGMNHFSGKLPPEIGALPLVVFNITRNNFSGEIPWNLSCIQCLQNLDLSYNNFSGEFPSSLNNLSELNKFNISYNPLISGTIPSTGQLATFERESFLGNPLLSFPALQNNSNRAPPEDLRPRRKREPANMAAFLVFIILTLSFILCGLLLVIACVISKHHADPPQSLLVGTKYRHDLESSTYGSSSTNSDTIKIIRLDKTAFTYTDILKATGHFSEGRIIGKGGFGTVYHGRLPDGREVAVKKLQREGVEGEREFQAEMEVLSSSDVGQPNLVTLYGWCLYGAEKLLVYEYMEGGSLEELLTDRRKLTWQRRIQIACDVARALVFLHHECHPAIVHRDVKASNVLLDRSGTAHVTDFGLARVVNAGDTHVSTIVAGTVGYVAPEYAQTWHATTKGDVYSFGMLAMELATARRAVDGGEECLLEWARRVIGEGRNGVSRVVPTLTLGLGLSEGAEELCELLKIGLRCTAEAPQMRPNMKEVLLMLISIGSGNASSSPVESG